MFRDKSSGLHLLFLHGTLVLVGGEEFGEVLRLPRILPHLLKQVFRTKITGATHLTFHETLVLMGGGEFGGVL